MQSCLILHNKVISFNCQRPKESADVCSCLITFETPILSMHLNNSDEFHLLSFSLPSDVSYLDVQKFCYEGGNAVIFCSIDLPINTRKFTNYTNICVM